MGFSAPILLAVAYFVARRFNGAPLGWADALLPVVLLIPPVIVVACSGASRLHHGIQVEVVGARYDRVLKLAPRIERVFTKKLGEAAGAAQGSEWRAKALIGLGRRDEAFAVMERLRARPDIPADVFLLHLGIVHAADKDWPAAARCFEEVVRIKPDSASAWLGVADAQANHLLNAQAARTALNMVRTFPASEGSASYIDLTEAGVQLLERRPEEARALALRAMPTLQRAARATPVCQFGVCMANALLAISCAQTGRAAEAREHFARAEPLLRLHGIDDVLNRCRHALGLPAERSQAPPQRL
jgi:tetratricopeptide (TPR) repeat protein